MNPDAVFEKLRTVKIPLLLLCAGLILVLTGGHGDRADAGKGDLDSLSESAAASLLESEKRLSSILREIDGVGEVHVLLSFETTSETEYVTDGDETVLVSAGSGSESALAKYLKFPRYQGAVIVCQGAEQASVRLHVIEAAARYTGLRSDQIAVLQKRK